MISVQLINKALNLAGIISRTLDSEDDEEGVDGLFWLNQLLAEKSATGMLLPYFAHVPILAVAGQEKYFIPDLVTAEVLTFSMMGVRYSVRGEQRNKYWGLSRAQNVNSLPFEWYWEREVGGMAIYLYFFPADAYELELTGLMGFSEVDFDTDLSLIMDKFYQNFLMFELAEALCLFYKLSLPAKTEEKLKMLRKQVSTINPRDFSIQKRSLTGGGSILSYGQINFGRGWTAS